MRLTGHQVVVPINLEYDSYGIYKNKETGLYDNWVLLKKSEEDISWDNKGGDKLVGKYQRKELVSVFFEKDNEYYDGNITLLGEESKTKEIYYFVRFDEDGDFGIFHEKDISSKKLD